MKSKIMTVIGLAGGAVAELFGGWDLALQTLVLFMAVDWFTGGILLPGVFGRSPKSPGGAMESRAGWKGLCRKAMTLFYVAKHMRKRSGGPFLSIDRSQTRRPDGNRLSEGCRVYRIPGK